MARVVARSRVDRAGLEAILRPRGDLLQEERIGEGRFRAAEGPVREYLRTVEAVEVDDHGDDGDDRDHGGGAGEYTVTQTVEFRLAVPYFGWLFVLPFKHALARPPRNRAPWWAPPGRLDARAATVLGTLALIAVAFGYLNTLFTQTITFAGEEFDAGNSAQGLAGSVVRVGGLLALVLVSAADRRGRRQVLLFAAVAGCLTAITGAVAPSLPWLTGSQMIARAFATSLLILVGIVAAEEMPAGSRAYAVSLLAMAGGLGAGVCVLALRLADLGPQGWRLLYVLPVVAAPVLARAGRRLPESRRFEAPHRAVDIAGHGSRLLLLAVSGLLSNLFIAPQSQFSNRFLRTERGFSGARIGLMTIAIGTPAGLGIVVGGRVADVRGRRFVAAIALVGGTMCTVAFFFSSGWPMWLWALAGTFISGMAVPALGVYGPELFPTGLRGRANGIVAVTSLAGSAAGLVLAGVLSDGFGRIGPAMAILAVGPLALAVLVLAAYPETARRELEELNPEDRPPP